VRGRLVKRSLGPVREPGSREGLTRTQAEARLRELILETKTAPPPVTERLTVADAGDRRIKHLARSGRKPDTTLANYESDIRIHFAPHFADKPSTTSRPTTSKTSSTAVSTTTSASTAASSRCR
jgi:hypothetical protein